MPVCPRSIVYSASKYLYVHAVVGRNASVDVVRSRGIDVPAVVDIVRYRARNVPVEGDVDTRAVSNQRRLGVFDAIPLAVAVVGGIVEVSCQAFPPFDWGSAIESSKVDC